MTALALDVTITDPGIYEDIPDVVYHSDPVEGGSLSSTGARAILAPGCPAKFRYDQLHPSPPKREFDLGHAAHQVVLGTGPELVVLDFDDYRKADAQKAKRAAHAAGQVPLLPWEYDIVEDMAAALRAHKVASALLNPAVGKTELTLVWRDRLTGVMCRARLDRFTRAANGRDLIVDYKTARSSEPGAIDKALQDRGYHQQLDFYRDGAMETGLSRDPVPLLVFQEKTPPYVVTVAQPAQSAMDIAAIKNRAAMETYAECKRTDVWPGYAEDIVLTTLPPYAERQFQEALDRGDYNTKGNR